MKTHAVGKQPCECNTFDKLFSQDYVNVIFVVDHFCKQQILKTHLKTSTG